MTLHDLKSIACRLAGKSLPVGRRLPNGVSAALAEYLNCSVDHARHLLAGSKKPNPQMEKLLGQYVKTENDLVSAIDEATQNLLESPLDEKKALQNAKNKLREYQEMVKDWKPLNKFHDGSCSLCGGQPARAYEMIVCVEGTKSIEKKEIGLCAKCDLIHRVSITSEKGDDDGI